MFSHVYCKRIIISTKFDGKPHNACAGIAVNAHCFSTQGMETCDFAFVMSCVLRGEMSCVQCVVRCALMWSITCPRVVWCDDMCDVMSCSQVC